MFDFSNDHKNPFMFLMDMDDEDAEAMEQFDFGGFADPMMFMQQAFMMQMQFASFMFMMPFRMMKAMADMMKEAAPDGEEEKAAEAPAKNGIKIGGMDVPPELLQKLLYMDMSPENLEKLQKALDFAFSMVPDKKEDKESREVTDEH